MSRIILATSRVVRFGHNMSRIILLHYLVVLVLLVSRMFLSHINLSQGCVICRVTCPIDKASYSPNNAQGRCFAVMDLLDIS